VGFVLLAILVAPLPLTLAKAVKGLMTAGEPGRA
jgi:hypothetical protein